MLTSCPTCLARASAGGAAVVGAAETTLLPPMRSHKCRQARRGDELTCKYWLKLCKSFCAAGNAYSLPEHCVRSHGQRDLSPTASHVHGSDRVSLSNLFSCNTFLQKMQPEYWAMTGLKKKNNKLAFWTTMKNMQKFPLCRGLWKKNSRSNSRLKLYKHTAKRTDTKLGKN